jgi:hypothetical protein
MGVAVDERRHAARFEAHLLAHLRTTLRPGNAVALVNLAVGGALVHSARPLRPGSRVHVQITGGTHIVRMSAHVLRCGVAGLNAEDGVVYIGALKFDSACDLPWADRRQKGSGG